MLERATSNGLLLDTRCKGRRQANALAAWGYADREAWDAAAARQTVMQSIKAPNKKHRARHGMSVLRYMAGMDSRHRLNEVSAVLQTSKTSAFRILCDLVAFGLLSRCVAGTRRHYYLITDLGRELAAAPFGDLERILEYRANE